MSIQIIKETSDYIIINKPAGLMVHADGRSTEKTLADFMVEQFPEIADVGEPLVLSNGEIIKRPGIVHRLDRETSGVMIIPRNQKSFEYFKKAFQDRQIEKTYHAFVYGNIKEDEREINMPIGRSKIDFRQWQAGGRARGEMRDAVTFIKVLKRSSDKQTTLVESKPKTGRTHQIRVHMKAVFHPLVCDSLYAPNRECLFGFNRTALHAYKIEFTDQDGARHEFVASYPDDFKNALENFVEAYTDN